jgi:hypothetical protein
MVLSTNYGRVGVIVSVAVSILMWTAPSRAFAAETVPIPQAPIGHVQPNASSVPPSVLREENALEAEDTKLDKELNICRGC